MATQVYCALEQGFGARVVAQTRCDHGLVAEHGQGIAAVLLAERGHDLQTFAEHAVGFLQLPGVHQRERQRIHDVRGLTIAAAADRDAIGKADAQGADRSVDIASAALQLRLDDATTGQRIGVAPGIQIPERLRLVEQSPRLRRIAEAKLGD